MHNGQGGTALCGHAPLHSDTRSRSFLPLSITLFAGGVQTERGEGSATGEETPLCQQGKRHAHSCLINTSFKDHKTYSAPLNPLFLYNGLGLGLRFGSITHKRACYFIHDFELTTSAESDLVFQCPYM